MSAIKPFTKMSVRSNLVAIDTRPSWMSSENAYSETFISRFGDELLKREVFSSLLEAKVLVEEYGRHYNHQRPHSALGYLTPAEFAASCDTAGANEGFTKELESVTTLS